MTPRKANPSKALTGAALHPGERPCHLCGLRMGDAERCEWVMHDATHQRDVFRHRECPSPLVAPDSTLGRAFRRGGATLERARNAYRRAQQLEGHLRDTLQLELAPLGRSLAEALSREHRLVAAALVLGYEEWERAHASVLNHP